MLKLKASLKKQSRVNRSKRKLFHLIHLYWNVISLIRGLVSLPFLNLLHQQNDLDNRKPLTYAVLVFQEAQKSKICEMKVEKTLNPVLNPKVITYISAPYNLQVGFYKSLVLYERVEFFDPRETPYIPINPLPKFKGQGKHKHQARGAAQAARPPATFERKRFAQDRREKPGRGGGRPNSKPPGMNDPYGIDIAPLNIFENQILPVGVHNLSKTFRPNMATIRVFFFGHKVYS